MEHLTEIKVRGYHADLYGHVNNARYLEFLEESRWDLLESCVELGDWAKKKWFFFVVNININYRMPVMPGQSVQVITGLEKVGGKSASLSQKIVFAGTDKVAADALVTFVVADGSGKAMPMEGELFREIERFRNSRN